MATSLIAAISGGSNVVLPPAPSRTEILNAQLIGQGLTVSTQQYGIIPAWGPEICMLDVPKDRQNYYNTFKVAGAKLLIFGIAGESYKEGSYTYPVPGAEMRWVNDLSGFNTRIAEALLNGFKGIQLMLPGDGFTTSTYKYGYEFTLDLLDELIPSLKNSRYGDLTKRIIFEPGWDGVVWTWNENQVMTYGEKIRSLLPNAYSGLEYPSGVLGVFGEGKEQYIKHLHIFDIFHQEYGFTPWDNLDQMWQISARMNAPLYKRGINPNQPNDDDPGAPFAPGSGNDYLSEGTSRGPFVYKPFEAWIYGWVRNICSVNQINEWRNYMISLGHPKNLVC
jgi:hypothetical protein